jgi:hypothetical protein
MRVTSKKALIATRRLQRIPPSLPAMSPKRFSPFARKPVNDHTYHLPDFTPLADAQTNRFPEIFERLNVSDSSLPELVSQEFLEESDEPTSNPSEGVCIAVTSPSNISSSSPAPSRLSNLSVTDAPASVKPLPDCPHGVSNHIRRYNSSGEFCVVRTYSESYRPPFRPNSHTPWTEEDLQDLFSFLKKK